MSRPFTAPRTTSPSTPIKAAALRPGDIVVDGTGARAYAAFDTAETETGDGRPAVCVYTAVSDQEAGVPAKVFLDAEEEVRVRSNRPTRFSRLSPNEDPSLPPFYGKPIDCPDGYRWAGLSAPVAVEDWRLQGTQADRRCRASVPLTSGQSYPCGNLRGACTNHDPKPVPASWPEPSFPVYLGVDGRYYTTP